jgi:hypothetical protein
VAGQPAVTDLTSGTGLTLAGGAGGPPLAGRAAGGAAQVHDLLHHCLKGSADDPLQLQPAQDPAAADIMAFAAIAICCLHPSPLAALRPLLIGSSLLGLHNVAAAN